jgi:hypothetical protein
MSLTSTLLHPQARKRAFRLLHPTGCPSLRSTALPITEINRQQVRACAIHEVHTCSVHPTLTLHRVGGSRG